VDPLLLDAVAALIAQDTVDAAIRAEMLRLPAEATLAELASHRGGVDVHGIHRARESLRAAMAQTFAGEWRDLYGTQRVRAAYRPEGAQIARRALCNVALDYCASAAPAGVELAAAHYREADNLTDRLSALRALLREADDARCDELLADFYGRFGHEALAVNHWLQIQAESPRGDAVARVRALMSHPAYDARNPNKIRAVVGAFANSNAVSFHREDGAGYALLAEVVGELNRRNPQIAARMLTPLTRWRNFQAGGELMRAELERLAALPDLSRDVYEVVSKALAAA
jgi:aminopeptidase N